MAFESERALLLSAGHEVEALVADNEALSSPVIAARAGFRVTGNSEWRERVRDEVERFRPDVVHVHNFFPELSPAAHEVAYDSGAAVVQTLHNYRFVCANAQLLRAGHPCEACVTGPRIQGVVHACYRSSRLASAAVWNFQRKIHTRAWLARVQRFIALTEFAKNVLVRGGLEAGKVCVLPNTIARAQMTERVSSEVPQVLYVGRLSGEKGIEPLLRAWTEVMRSGVRARLKVVGDGPAREALGHRDPVLGVEFTGWLEADQVRSEMARSVFLVLPSLWYEGFPMVAVEALAAGLPVMASRIGGLPELVEDGVSGWLATPDHVGEWAQKLIAVLGDPTACSHAGVAARARFERHYAPERKLSALESVYRDAIEMRRKL